MVDFDAVNYMSADEELVRDPYPYYDHLRGTCPVQHVESLGVVALTGYDQVAAVQRDAVNYSSANCLAGLFPPLDIPPDCDDLGPLIEAARAAAPRALAPLANVLVSLDPPTHTAQRALLTRIFSPKRLRENEEYMWHLADRQIDEFIERGACELYTDFAQPFTQLVVADLLGVPEAEHKWFREHLSRGPLESTNQQEVTSVDFLEQYFSEYIEERRRLPRDDFLTHLAGATYPDGSTPEPVVVGRVASFLFAAGADTTAGLILSGTRILCEQPEIQERLRREPDRVPDFVEETLRFDGVVKTAFRMARRATEIDGTDIPIGTSVMVLPSAANRDPVRFPDPDRFDLDRPNAREHVAFGRGPHACAGAPLARTEARVAFSRLVSRLADIRLSEAHHGAAGSRHYDFEPSYILRRLLRLDLEFIPAG